MNCNINGISALHALTGRQLVTMKKNQFSLLVDNVTGPALYDSLQILLQKQSLQEVNETKLYNFESIDDGFNPLQTNTFFPNDHFTYTIETNPINGSNGSYQPINDPYNSPTPSIEKDVDEFNNILTKYMVGGPYKTDDLDTSLPDIDQITINDPSKFSDQIL